LNGKPVIVLTYKGAKSGKIREKPLIGNFSAEASEHSEIIRTRIVEIFEEMRQSVAYCLRAAVKTGELPRKPECDELGGFLVASLQGAILQSKAERSSVSVERFKHLLFSTLLR
jgi:TetR/AcrR family transcriptional regulator, transcriptional repressor for nem operon